MSTSKQGYYISPEGVKMQKYMAGSSTINPATTSQITYSTSLTDYASRIFIANDSGLNLNVRLNSSANHNITIAAGEDFDDEFQTTEIWMVNATTTSIDYRYYFRAI